MAREEFWRRIDEIREKVRREIEEGGRNLHQQFTIVIGTIGSIAFAGLVLILQDQSTFKVPWGTLISGDWNFDGLVLLLATVSALSSFSVLASSFVGAGILSFDSKLGMFGYITGLVAVITFLLGVEVIVGDITTVGDNIFTGILVALGAGFLVSLWISWRDR